MVDKLFDFISYGAEKLQLLLLIILRTSGLFLMAPILGHRNVSSMIRAGLLILLSLILVSSLALDPLPVAGSIWQLAGLAFRELLVGVIVGMVFNLLFLAIHTAGGMLGYQMGFAVVTQYDANLSGQVSTLGRLWYIVAVLIFLTINGHHLMIRAFADSYELIPPGAAFAGGTFTDMFIRLTAYVFVLALKIIAPVTVTLFMTDVALGTIAKTMPTLNVFFMGMPLKIAIGLTVMAMAMPVAAWVFQRAIGYFDTQLDLVLNALGKA